MQPPRHRRKHRRPAGPALSNIAHREQIKARDAAYRAAHREKLKAKSAAYYAAHREKLKAKSAAYYAAHREKLKAKYAAYYAAHREKIKARKAAYYAAHREKIRARNAAYRAAHREHHKARDAAYHFLRARGRLVLPRSLRRLHSHQRYSGGRFCFCDVCGRPLGWRSPSGISPRGTFCREHSTAWRKSNDPL